jgi:two-component system, NarL family, sensor histidine kinase DesK
MSHPRGLHDGDGTTVAVVEPATVPGPTPRVRPRWKYAWVWAAIWLAYLYQSFVDAWHQPEPAKRWLALALVTLFSATFICSFAILPRLQRRLATPPNRAVWPPAGWGIVVATGLVVTGAALGVGITAVLGQAHLAVFVFVAVMAVFLLPGIWGPVAVAGLIVTTVLAQLLIPGWAPDLSVQFQIFVGGLAMWGVVQIIKRNRELDAAHQEIARLAVEEERNRFARDMHDIVGHSLTVIAVKAELAGRLVRLDPDRAEAELTDVERLSREALGEVRTAVAGYRDVTLSAELANARTALSAAGIDADLPSAIDDVPAERRELFGWVVREGVTNVIRHSGASRCWVRISPSTVTVSDDGRSMSSVDGGHGLVGLRERAEALGGSLRVTRSPGGGFGLTVTV